MNVGLPDVTHKLYVYLKAHVILMKSVVPEMPYLVAISEKEEGKREEGEKKRGGREKKRKSEKNKKEKKRKEMREAKMKRKHE